MASGHFYFTDDLVSALKRYSYFPEAQQTLQSSDLISILNDELTLNLAAELMKVRINHFLTSKTVSTTANVPRIVIPERAIGSTIKNIYLVDGAGGRTPIVYGDVDVLEGAAAGAASPTDFLFSGDEIILVPTPSGVSNLEIWFYRMLSKLVLTASCAKITAVSSLAGTTTFTVNTDLTGSLSIGDKVDFVSGKSPFLSWADDVTITAISATQIQVATTDVDDESGAVEPIANDYICPAGTSCIPQIPRELHPVLVQMGVVSMMQPIAHLPKYQLAKDRLERMRDSAFKLIVHRVEMQPELLVDNESPNALAGSGAWNTNIFS